MEKASYQLNRAINDYIEPNFKLFLDRIGFSSLLEEQIKIIPVIISSLPLATGQKFQNIPVVDLEIIKRYLNEGKISNWVFNGESENLISETPFYSSEEEAEKSIGQYLAEPPQISMFFKNVRWENVPIANLHPNQKPIYCVKGFVKSLI